MADTVAKVPWGVWAAAPLVFQLIFKKYGGYYYRSMVAIIAVLVSCTHGLILAMVLPFIGKGNQIAMLSGRVCSFLIKHFLGVVPVIEGSHHFNNLGPSVIVCNHQSVLDILLMGSVCSPGTVCVTKKSLKYYPIFGWFLSAGKAVFLDRSNRKTAVEAARKAATDIQSNKISPWIFPEGTRSGNDKPEMLQFKKGAFYMAKQANVPVVPIVFENYFDLFNTKNHVFKAGNIKIKVLPPVSTTQYDETSEDMAKLCDDVYSKMDAEYKQMYENSKKRQ